MKENYLSRKALLACLLFIMMVTTNVFGQIGIGTVTPNASSVLDVSSTTKGMLTPRMTTVQRTAITTPADGLIVYDTDLKSFYYYNTTTATWIKINSEADGRLKFKRIKSTDVLATVLAAELSAGGGAKYLLDTGTLYEINGSIYPNFPIDLNNAYLEGLDTNEDKLIRVSGNLFEGAFGGSIRNLTLVAAAGSVFNLNGAATESLIFRDCILASSASCGLIKGFGLVFINVVNYSGNAAGMTYEDISRLLINNSGWFSNNSGSYERLVGTFALVEKLGGFSDVTGANFGFDVSANPIITGDAVLESTVFTGTLTTGGYVKPYTVGTYPGYNFTGDWNVRSAGIFTETDATATGNLFDPSNTATTRTTTTVQNTGYKLTTNPTTATNLLRFASTTTGRLTYKGEKTRTFQVTASISFIETTAGSNTTYVFYVAKIATNGTTVTALPETETFNDTNGGFIQSFPVSGSVVLATNESVEIWVKRINTGTKINVDTYSFNITAR